MARIAALILGTVALAVSIASSAQRAPSYAVASLQCDTLTLVKLPQHSWVGFAVYLGGGKILTASHVAGPITRPLPFAEIAGLTLPTKRLKQGRFEDVDLAELSIDRVPIPQQLASLPPLAICKDDPTVGTPVLVITPTQIARSHIVSTDVIPPELFAPGIIAAFPTLIADVYSTGNSGSGVFDAGSGCLLGIMSRKIEMTETSFVDGIPTRTVKPLAKYFVGPMVIRRFLEDKATP